MALTTYAQLQTAAADWSHRSDLTSILPDLITVAETQIFRDIRTKDMETAFTSTVSAGTIATPTSYIDLKYAYVDTSTVQWLERKPAKWIYENYPSRSSDGVPVFVAREGSTFIFGPYPDSSYTIKGVYYKNIGPLSTSAHAVFTENPDVYLYRTLYEIALFTKDTKMSEYWLSRYGVALKQAQDKSDREEYSGSTLRMVAG